MRAAPTHFTANAENETAFPVPSAASAAYAYHVACDALAPNDETTASVRAVYDEVFELERHSRDAPALLRAMAESDLPLRLAVAPRLFHAAVA